MSKVQVTDKRYTIGIELVNFQQMFVVRFCGDFIRGFLDRRDAELCALNHCLSDSEVIQTYRKEWALLVCVDHVLWLKKGKWFRICYGADVKDFTDDLVASECFGHCVRHQLECDGMFN